MNTVKRIGTIALLFVLLAGLTSFPATPVAADETLLPNIPVKIREECPVIWTQQTEVVQFESAPKDIDFLPDGRLVIGLGGDNGLAIETPGGGWDYFENPLPFRVFDVAIGPGPQAGDINIAVAHWERPWVPDQTRRGVMIFDLERGYFSHATSENSPVLWSPVEVIYTLDGSLWVAGHCCTPNTVARRNPDWSWREYAMPLGRARHLALGPNGELYTAEYSVVSRYNPAGDEWEQVACLDPDCTDGWIQAEVSNLEVASDGTIWAAGDHLYRISPEGEVQSYELNHVTFGEELTIDITGRVWVGGYGGPGNLFPVVEAFDPHQNRWIHHTYWWEKEWKNVSALASQDGKIYIGISDGELVTLEVGRFRCRGTGVQNETFSGLP